MHDRSRGSGSGSCPCGKGSITVDGASAAPSIDCVDCSATYGFYRVPGLSAARLVERSSLQRLSTLHDQYRHLLDTLERTPDFLALGQAVIEMARERPSRLQQYSLLKRFGLTAGLPYHQFELSRFRITGAQTWLAAAMTGSSTSHLDALWREADLCRLQSLAIPPGIATGIDGLEM